MTPAAQEAAGTPAPYAVFLRGINVNGITLRMEDLRQAVASLPVAEVRTVLATGNLVCTSALGPAELKARVEERLREAFGYEAWVVVLEARQLAELVKACPFPADDPDVHAYVTLFSDGKALSEIASAAAAAGENLVVLSAEAAAWQARRGATLDSELSKLTSKGRFRPVSTTRNLRTLNKVLAALPG